MAQIEVSLSTEINSWQNIINILKHFCEGMQTINTVKIQTTISIGIGMCFLIPFYLELTVKKKRYYENIFINIGYCNMC
jgi:hypothetical protein